MLYSMIEHVKIYFPSDGKILIELHTGTLGVEKMFFDKDDKSTLVVCNEEGIVTYTGFLYVCMKSYKEK